MCLNKEFSKIVEETAKLFTGSDTDCCIVAKSIGGIGDISMAGSEFGLIYCMHTMLKEIATYNNIAFDDIVEYMKNIETGPNTLKTETNTLVFPLADQ